LKQLCCRATGVLLRSGRLPFLARPENPWVDFEDFGSLPDFQPIRYRARRGQGTCPQDKPVYSRCAVRDLPTAPRVEAYGLTR